MSKNIKLLILFVIFFVSPEILFAANNVKSKTVKIVNKNENYQRDQTILQAEKDLNSNNEELRLGAAKLLGKYNSPKSRSVLVNALNDKSVRVRRAAAVSILEKIRYIELGNFEKFLDKVDDHDLEVRRSVSSGMLSVGARLTNLKRAQLRSGLIQKKITYQQLMNIRYSLPKELEQKVRAAAFDSDPIVRLNIIKSYRSLYLQFSSENFTRHLKDSNEKLLIEILKIVNSVPFNKEIIDQLSLLATNGTRGVKTQLMISLITIRNPKIIPVLKMLSNEDDLVIKLGANIGIGLITKTIDPNRIKKIVSLFLELDKDTKVVIDMLYKLVGMGNYSVQMYKELTKHKKVKIRSVAWTMYLRFPNVLNIPGNWFSGLSDPSLSVRTNVVRNVIRIRAPLPIKLMEKLVKNPNKDVRKSITALLKNIQVKDFSRIALMLLIDDDIEVRIKTLTIIAQRRIGNWGKILGRSLLDRNRKLQEHVARALMFAGVEGKAILESFIAKHPNKSISKTIKSRLEKKKRKRVRKK